MESVKINHEGLLNLEQPMIKVPIEQLKRQFKISQKMLEKEIQFISQRVAQENELKKNPSVVKEMITRLKTLKKRVGEQRELEELAVKRAKSRISYLEDLFEIPSVDSEAYDRWSKTRLNHMIVDYLARQGFSETALKLSQDADIEDLVDLDLFAQAQRIQDSLSKKDCSEALQWCAENKSNLKKIKSSLEFNLRLQEYIELIRDRKLLAAIQYSKKYLTPWSETHLKEIQQASGLLAFDPATDCSVYKVLYDQRRWKILVKDLQLDVFTLNSLTKQPMLNLTLQAGLTAMKTYSCNNPDDRNVNCPVCAADTFGALSKTLPHAHHVNSSLVCRISGKVMDESNPPLVLPSGYVYSALALKEMQERDGSILCPRSGNTYTLAETRKAFIS